MQMPMTKPEPRDKAALVQQGTPTMGRWSVILQHRYPSLGNHR